MKMTEHLAAIDSYDVGDPVKRHVDKSDAPLQSPSTSGAQGARPAGTLSAAKFSSTADTSEKQTAIRQAFAGAYNSSHAPLTRSSTSSLQAPIGNDIVDARSENCSIGRCPQRSSRHSESRSDYPVYPDQSYMILQSQVHPTRQPPFLRPRSAYSSQPDSQSLFEHTHTTRVADAPVSSPGLFSMGTPGGTSPMGSDLWGWARSPCLHPAHLQPPSVTHNAEVNRDFVTGNKLINQYEILEDLARGEHSKVKLGRHVTTKQKVAIKILRRSPKRRWLDTLGNPEDKVKEEVAILKKARHPNVVSLLEVIDDPNRQKVYLVLEYVENGEIVWRKKGRAEIFHVDKLRLDREKAGIFDSPAFLEESHQYIRTAQRLRRQRQKAREQIEAQAADAQQAPIPAWSLEHGAESSDEDEACGLMIGKVPMRSATFLDVQTSKKSSFTKDPSLAAIEGSMYGAYAEFPLERQPSAVSSSFGYSPTEPEWSTDDGDMLYVPCLTIAEARNAFRDSILGLEYLHYQNIIHRDIKPANLLVTSDHRVKISDFGVSYLGRPIQDNEEEQVDETDTAELANARGLSKTVGTPAFYAPELCYTGDDFVKTIGSVPKITGAIDVWSLGVTLFAMIYGRLPFNSVNEYSLFQTIVKKEAFIPRKRLVPVIGDSLGANQSQWNRRNSDELVYEDIDDELYNLLRRLLTRDPIKRITVKEIKHHPWILHGLSNPRAWVEDTDPEIKGKKIELSNEEVTGAVSKVPIM